MLRLQEEVAGEIQTVDARQLLQRFCHPHRQQFHVAQNGPAVRIQRIIIGALFCGGRERQAVQRDVVVTAPAVDVHDDMRFRGAAADLKQIDQSILIDDAALLELIACLLIEGGAGCNADEGVGQGRGNGAVLQVRLSGRFRALHADADREGLLAAGDCDACGALCVVGVELDGACLAVVLPVGNVPVAGLNRDLLAADRDRAAGVFGREGIGFVGPQDKIAFGIETDDARGRRGRGPGRGGRRGLRRRIAVHGLRCGNLRYSGHARPVCGGIAAHQEHGRGDTCDGDEDRGAADDQLAGIRHAAAGGLGQRFAEFLRALIALRRIRLRGAQIDAVELRRDRRHEIDHGGVRAVRLTRRPLMRQRTVHQDTYGVQVGIGPLGKLLKLLVGRVEMLLGRFLPGAVFQGGLQAGCAVVQQMHLQRGAAFLPGEEYVVGAHVAVEHAAGKCAQVDGGAVNLLQDQQEIVEYRQRQLQRKAVVVTLDVIHQREAVEQLHGHVERAVFIALIDVMRNAPDALGTQGDQDRLLVRKGGKRILEIRARRGHIGTCGDMAVAGALAVSAHEDFLYRAGGRHIVADIDRAVGDAETAGLVHDLAEHDAAAVEDCSGRQSVILVGRRKVRRIPAAFAYGHGPELRGSDLTEAIHTYRRHSGSSFRADVGEKGHAESTPDTLMYRRTGLRRYIKVRREGSDPFPPRGS